MTSISLVLPVRRRGSRGQESRGQEAGRREFWLRRVAAALVARWRQAALLRETRRYVMTMDDRTLADLGISRAQALFEIDRKR